MRRLFTDVSSKQTTIIVIMNSNVTLALVFICFAVFFLVAVRDADVLASRMFMRRLCISDAYSSFLDTCDGPITMGRTRRLIVPIYFTFFVTFEVPALV